MTASERVAKLAKQLVGKASQPDPLKIARSILGSISETEKDELLLPTLVKASAEAIRSAEMAARYGVSTPKMTFQPRDTGSSTERVAQHAIEREIMEEWSNLPTIQHKGAALLSLTPTHYRVGSKLIPAGQMTRADWLTYRDFHVKKRDGHNETIRFIDEVLDFLRETKADTIDEAVLQTEEKELVAA